MEIKVLIIKQKYPIILWRFPKSISPHLLKMLGEGKCFLITHFLLLPFIMKIFSEDILKGRRYL